MTDISPSRGTAWLVLWLIAIASFPNFYVYDSIGPVADLLQQQRQFSDSDIGLLNAIYSLPNILLVVVGGMLVDRLGAGVVALWTSVICLFGAVLTAWGSSLAQMAAGRLLFGIGGETYLLATTAALLPYFGERGLAFALGFALALGRAGSWSADMSPTWFASAYARGWQPPLVIAAVLAAVCVVVTFVYERVDRPYFLAARAGGKVGKIHVLEVLRAGAPYWLLVLLCVLWYAVILAFRSTFAIKYFQHAHGLDLATAGQMNGYVFFAAMFATPLFGWVCDRTGRYLPLITLGAALLPIALIVLRFTHADVWIATVLIGISYSLVPAVLWPLVARVVPEGAYGSALGVMWVLQDAAIAGANLWAGALNDAAHASAASPAGYDGMMDLFTVASVLGLLASIGLWIVSVTRAPSSSARGAPATVPASSP